MEAVEQRKHEQRRCANCRKPLDHDARSEEQRLAELKKNFGNVPVTDCEVVCTECYKQILAWHRSRD